MVIFIMIGLICKMKRKTILGMPTSYFKIVVAVCITGIISDRYLITE